MCVGGFGLCVSDVGFNYGGVVFFVLISKFCDEGDVASSIKRYLNLEDELCERVSYCVTHAIVAI